MALPSLATAGAIAAIASPLSKSLVDTWITPKLVELVKDKTIEKMVIDHSFESKFAEYLARAYERQSFIRTVVFQNQRLLEDLYLPLTVKSANKSEVDTVVIDSYKAELIPKYGRVLLTDTAGMGKSTVSRYLFLKCLAENMGVPIFVELRQLSGDKTILDIICSELNPIDDEFDKDFILKLIRRGDFVFFLDGYDEIPFAERDKATIALQEFIAKSANNNFILTSRPESALASFADFQQFVVQPLSKEEAFELIRKYDDRGPLAEQLIDELEGDMLKNVEEFLTNPLLVSLLYKAYQFKPSVPLKKPTFYRQVYDSLFEDHDLTKPGSYKREKRSGLDVDDFNRVLRALGFFTVKLGQVEYTKDEVLSHIGQAKNSCAGLSFNANDFLNDLLTTVPLFLQEGQQYKWNHKSIQEYFAALFICTDAKADQPVILEKMADNREYQRFLNVLDLCYDIDYKTFRHTLVYRLVSSFVDYHDKSYTGEHFQHIAEDEMELRKSLCFGISVFLFPLQIVQDNTANDQVNASILFQTIAKQQIVPEATPVQYGSALPDTGAALIGVNGMLSMLSILIDKNETIGNLVPHADLSQSAFRIALREVCASIEEIIVVTDDPKAIVNNGKLFAATNQVIRSLKTVTIRDQRTYWFFLSYPDCLKLKNIIEAELGREQGNNSLATGL